MVYKSGWNMVGTNPHGMYPFLGSSHKRIYEYKDARIPRPFGFGGSFVRDGIAIDKGSEVLRVWDF